MKLETGDIVRILEGEAERQLGTVKGYCEERLQWRVYLHGYMEIRYFDSCDIKVDCDCRGHLPPPDYIRREAIGWKLCPNAL